MGDKRWIIIVAVMVVLGIIAFLFSTVSVSGTGNIALISVQGVIVTSGGGLFDATASSQDIVSLIHQANNDPSVDAILLEINSPGGSAVASEEIGNALRRANKPVVAYIRDAGASGGYWIASEADKIYASPLSIVGSVGVTAAQLNFAGLLDMYNVSYNQLTAGEYKDIGTPFREMQPDERERLQIKLDLMHEHFLGIVQENRDLSPQVMEEISKADFYTGIQAKELGLIDDFGGQAEAHAYLEETLGKSLNIIPFQKDPTFFDIFSSMSITIPVTLEAQPAII